MTTASVILYGTRIGVVAWDEKVTRGFFEYDEVFLNSGIEIAPLRMPLRAGIYSFPDLAKETFKGLPGLLADALPDKFGNLLIDQWLAQQNRNVESFNPVERLCYLGSRALGALEFEPALSQEKPTSSLEISNLVELANAILTNRKELKTKLISHHEDEALAEILRVGTSAGGARAKAVISWNPVTGEIRSGQVSPPSGFEAWLLKFDGVDGNSDKELADPKGYGRLEYAYHLMARASGITMTDCGLLEENGRAHFMTRRFDRSLEEGKIHLQTLCALGHYDFNQAGGYSYEQAFQLARNIGCGNDELSELYQRAVFNILARNQDDHTKNISFLMNRRGQWSLAPAYDVTFSYNPRGIWTSQHQMSLNGKRDSFDLGDLLDAAKAADVKPRRAKSLIDSVQDSLADWPRFADDAGVLNATAQAIKKQFRHLK